MKEVNIAILLLSAYVKNILIFGKFMLRIGLFFLE